MSSAEALLYLEMSMEEIERRWPKRSITIARVLVYLMRKANRPSRLPDLSQALGHGRDSTVIQGCIADLASIGLIEVTSSRPKTVRLATDRAFVTSSGNTNSLAQKIEEKQHRSDVIDTSKTLSEAARQLGISVASVISYARRHDIDISRFARVKKIDHARLNELIQSGASVGSMAQEFGVTRKAIYFQRKKMGLL